jgi:uncharacterized protein involved in exopolysaccharide biosynthesis
MINSDSVPHNHIPPGQDEVSLVEFANTVLRHWRIILVIPSAFAVIVFSWTITRERSYSASASFVPQVADTRGMGGAAALAQQFGVNLGSERPGQSPQFYVELLRSPTLLREVVRTEFQLPSGGGPPVQHTLIQHWDLEEGWRRSPSQRAVEMLRDRISASVNRETGIVRIAVSSEDPHLSEQIVDQLLYLLNEYNLSVRQDRAREEGRFIEGRIAESQRELIAAEEALQHFLSHNRDFRNSPELTFEHDRLQRQVMMRQEVYSSLLRSQEQARIDAVRDTPLFTVIDHPSGSAEPEGRGTVGRVVLAILVGLMLAVLTAYLVEFARRRREAEDPNYREMQTLAREAWEDARHPGRWMRGRRKAVAARDH